MKLFSVVLLLLACPALRADETKKEAAAPTRELVIEPQGSEKDWDASIADVEKVLRSAAGELWKHVPQRKLHAIRVQPKGGPIVLFRRGEKNEYIVKLDTGGTYWSQYAFQFAHEFTHILCAYRDGDASNQWFEESLCELGSLFALRQMAESWKTKPPYPNWNSYAPRLGEYAQDRLDKAKLPDGQTLAQWYAKHAEALTKEATDRELNTVVAAALLDLFEKSPESWGAVESLNAKKGKEKRDFARCLSDWHASVAKEHRPFVGEVANRFGITLDARPRE